MARAMPYACLHSDPPRPDWAGGHDPRIARLGSGGITVPSRQASRPWAPRPTSWSRVKEEGGGGGAHMGTKTRGRRDEGPSAVLGTGTRGRSMGLGGAE